MTATWYSLVLVSLVWHVCKLCYTATISVACRLPLKSIRKIKVEEKVVYSLVSVSLIWHVCKLCYTATISVACRLPLKSIRKIKVEEKVVYSLVSVSLVWHVCKLCYTATISVACRLPLKCNEWGKSSLLIWGTYNYEILNVHRFCTYMSVHVIIIYQIIRMISIFAV